MNGHSIARSEKYDFKYKRDIQHFERLQILYFDLKWVLTEQKRNQNK